jgi:hypothetical protein
MIHHIRYTFVKIAKHQVFDSFRQTKYSLITKTVDISLLSKRKEDTMKIQNVAVAVTAINFALMTFWLPQVQQTNRAQTITPVLRGRSLEIIDSLGKVRASITIQPPVEVDGKKYPQTVLLRLIDSKGKPLVKLGAAENGAGLTLINSSDEGVLIHGHDDGSFVKITHQKKERVIAP